jgi:hypothetical protein
MQQELDTGKWRRFFLRNKLDRPEPAWEAHPDFTEPAQALVEQSLREFQLGDGGGPAALIAWNREAYRNSQEGLAEVVDLWFAEEKEHSRLLGGAAAALPARAHCGALELQPLLRTAAVAWRGV